MCLGSAFNARVQSSTFPSVNSVTKVAMRNASGTTTVLILTSSEGKRPPGAFIQGLQYASPSLPCWIRLQWQIFLLFPRKTFCLLRELNSRLLSQTHFCSGFVATDEQSMRCSGFVTTEQSMRIDCSVVTKPLQNVFGLCLQRKSPIFNIPQCPSVTPVAVRTGRLPKIAYSGTQIIFTSEMCRAALWKYVGFARQVSNKVAPKMTQI